MIRLDLFEHLQAAMSAPQEAQLLDLLREFDAVISGLEDRAVLEVAANALLQLATIVEAKYVGVIEAVKAEVQPRGARDPVVSIDFFDAFVRRSMVVDFEEFIEPIPLLPLPCNLEGDWSVPHDLRSNYISEAAVAQAIREAMIDDAVVLLDALPDRQPLIDIDAIKDLSHGEEIEAWTTELVAMMEKLQQRKRKTISLLDLVCTLEISRTQSGRKRCLIDLWMTFLLGKHPYQLRRAAHNFYSLVGIEVVCEPDPN
ncbi:hypothetical protein H6F89_32205 [Cyanobacteria bacterium FACHB-63]|uniref:hypothetical protein n=1 Tax=Leptolyngbya sp. DQ-M1 TaxID=2933920 RepID=UPI0019A8A419|nr:hypothetical protein [Cyanobacteria bacterium FACHB-DQ100]MBD1847957.1 hypothetical protein [Cyanobacteria bacterium FACHB-63]